MKKPYPPIKILFLIALILFVAGFAAYTAGEKNAINAALTAASGPLIFSEPVTDAHTNEIIQQARADFAAVAIGKSPIYAKRDTSIPLPNDGGTTVFKAPGYSLVAVKSLTQLGGVSGYIYGPVIYFEKAILIGNSDSISQLSFYSNHALQELLKPGWR